MPFFGDMTFDASASEIEVSSLSGNGVSDVDGDGILELTDIAGDDDYSFSLKAPSGTYGTYTVVVNCVSDAPTKSPTSEPTYIPSVSPTDIPTSEPTDEPTSEPTKGPTTEPTTGSYMVS